MTGAISRLPGQNPQDTGKLTLTREVPARQPGVSARTWHMLRAAGITAAALSLVLLCLAIASRTMEPKIFPAMCGLAGVILVYAAPFAIYAHHRRELRTRLEAAHGYATVEHTRSLSYWLINDKTGAILRKPGDNKLTASQIRQRRRTP